MTKLSAFISYQRQRASEAVARHLYTELRARGIDVYYDHDLKAGEDWTIVLDRELTARDVQIVVLTPDTVLPPIGPSKGVEIEIKKSLAQGKRIIPVLANGFHFEHFPALPPAYEALRDWKWVLYDASPAAAINEIAEALGYATSPASPVPPPTPAAAQVTMYGPPQAPPPPPAAPQGDADAAPPVSILRRPEVVVALIAGLFGLVTAVVTGFFGLAPSLLDRWNAESTRAAETANAVTTTADALQLLGATATEALLQRTRDALAVANLTLVAENTQIAADAQATGTAFAAGTLAPTATSLPTVAAAPPAPSGTPEVLCMATVRGSGGAVLSIVRIRPSTTSTITAAVREGDSLRVLERSVDAQGGVWYRVENEIRTESGWVEDNFLLLAPDCP